MSMLPLVPKSKREFNVGSENPVLKSGMETSFNISTIGSGDVPVAAAMLRLKPERRAVHISTFRKPLWSVQKLC